MENMGMTADDALGMLGVADEERPAVLEKL